MHYGYSDDDGEMTQLQPQQPQCHGDAVKWPVSGCFGTFFDLSARTTGRPSILLLVVADFKANYQDVEKHVRSLMPYRPSV